jgi:hypothetical protein
VAGIINSVRDWLRAARVSAEDLDRLADEVADVRTT